MFKSIYHAISICLQGTPLELRSKHGGIVEKQPQPWVYPETNAECPPYTLVDDFRAKNDLITKLHTVDNRLQREREGSRGARAKWMPDYYEQVYYGEQPAALDGQVEIYYKTLGLAHTREQTMLGRR